MQYDSWFDSDENKTLLAICARKLIRNIGIGGIIWGLINMAIGAVAIQVTIINAGLLLLGIIMLGAGIRALRRPSLGALLTETVITVLLFLWNLGITLINSLAGGKPESRGLIIPLIIACVFASNYRKLGHVRDLIAAVPREKIETMKQACKVLLKKKLDEEPSVVQARGRTCRAQLMDDRAFFIQRNLTRAFVATRDAVSSAIAKPEAKRWTAVFNHPLGKLKYRFDKENTQKLKAWLSAAEATTVAVSGSSSGAWSG